jgi:hypothetical protein
MKLSDYDLHNLYDANLDEVYPETSIAGMTYQTSRALKEVDPTAYSCGFSDWLDAEISDGHIFEKNDEYYDEDSTETENDDEA